MKPLTPSDLEDLSSETETPSEGESDVKFVVESDTSDPSSESAEETEDPVYPVRWTSKNGAHLVSLQC